MDKIHPTAVIADGAFIHDTAEIGPFCVIEKDDIVQRTFTTHYRSAVVFGRAKILTEDSEKQFALEALLEKYSPDYFEEGQKEIEDSWKTVCVAEIAIEHMTGKAAMELLEK